MLRRIVVALLTLGLCSCTELPPLPGTGGSGGGGAGGQEGASGGSAGGGGTGGASDAGVDPCEQVVLSKAVGTETNDLIQDGKALGFVCSDGQCREGLDLFDRWSMEDACSRRYAVRLTWTNNDGTSNLDLALFGANEDLLAQSASLGGNEEEITYPLEAAETYTIEVQAETTAGLKRDYDLSVFVAD